MSPDEIRDCARRLQNAARSLHEENARLRAVLQEVANILWRDGDPDCEWSAETCDMISHIPEIAALRPHEGGRS